MRFTPEEINNIGIIVERIEKVAEVISQQLDKFVYDASTNNFHLRKGEIVRNICKDVYKASCLYLSVSDPPSNLIRDIFAKIYWDKPEIAKDLEERYYRHIYDVSQLFKIKDAANLYNELFNVQYNLSDLAKTLQAGAKMAKAETEKPAEKGRNNAHTIRWRIWTCVKRIPRWIYVLVIFLAALLTCLYQLGWL